jgi:hypothetical protein
MASFGVQVEAGRGLSEQRPRSTTARLLSLPRKPGRGFRRAARAIRAFGASSRKRPATGRGAGQQIKPLPPTPTSLSLSLSRSFSRQHATPSRRRRAVSSSSSASLPVSCRALGSCRPRTSPPPAAAAARSSSSSRRSARHAPGLRPASPVQQLVQAARPPVGSRTRSYDSAGRPKLDRPPTGAEKTEKGAKALAHSTSGTLRASSFASVLEHFRLL